jgi:hypothetical protein
MMYVPLPIFSQMEGEEIGDAMREKCSEKRDNLMDQEKRRSVV